MQQDGSRAVELRCSAYRCDNMVSVTDDEMSEPKWRRYHVHCHKHRLAETNTTKENGVDKDELEEELAKMEREMEAEPPETGNMRRCHEVTHAMIAAARVGLGERPTAQQAAWVVRMFMDNADCTFSRKVEIMFPDDGGALYALHSAGGGSLSNALFEAVDEDSGVRRALKFIDEEAEWSKPLDHVRDLLREALHG
ncbi:hypothetical protein LCGC14_0813680 [marine sediment metagenome]|uniref:Uncharacterized protein n=1 Tax=marine sediment metagenome TaxID=412755 RepID=A0A0F9S5U6_9ZZZZ